MNRSYRALAYILACGLVPVSSAFGSTIGISNTGESSGGTALPVGTLDPHYTLISAPSGVPLTATAETPNGAYTANTATADWIGPSSNGNDSFAVGNYDYRTTFSLTGDNPATAQLSGSWASDNNACIYLNGVNTGDCTPFAGFSSLTSFSITSGFVAGTNTLDFVVTNGGGPTGVFAEVSGTASPVSATTPEPASWMLAASGVLALGGFVRRRMDL